MQSLLLLLELEIHGEDVFNLVVHVVAINQPLSLFTPIQGSPTVLAFYLFLFHESPNGMLPQRNRIPAWK